MSIGNQAIDASKFSLRNICSEHISLYPYPYRCPLSHKRCHLLDVCDGTAHVPNTIIVLSFAHGNYPHLNTTFRCYYYAESQSYIYVNNLVRMDFKTSLANGIVARRTFPNNLKAQPPRMKGDKWRFRPRSCILIASVSQLFISKALSIASWIACKPSAKSNVDHGLQAN